ncbi:VOC family protein [Leptospira harrisiae]|uniref:Glyoxalase n=1 Tax=Leptospira harrisiae TaxID=2023189 RepID=A0A2N0APT0_9LEPT|nr:VOC family protein [Leptospira harrisiae]PJZ86298.1 glyoxalase [Leptospira harrisiae]PKA09863.1 glyoxalase [Leptospira harrisiae]
MIKKIRHTGLVVRNLSKAMAFYEALGFVLWKREIEEGDFIDTVVGIQSVKLETAKMHAKDGAMIELLEYHSHPSQKDMVNSPSNTLGCSHIAFTVGDIEETCKLVLQLGGNVVNQPAISPSGKVKVAYCHDVDGILLELVEEIV